METIFNVIASNLANKMPFKSLFKELGDANINSEQKLKYLMFSAYCFYFDGDITHTKEILNNKEVDFLKLIPYFSELIFIRAFGNGEKFSEEQLMIDLTSLEQKVKSVISLYR